MEGNIKQKENQEEVKNAVPYYRDLNLKSSKPLNFSRERAAYQRKKNQIAGALNIAVLHSTRVQFHYTYNIRN